MNGSPPTTSHAGSGHRPRFSSAWPSGRTPRCPRLAPGTRRRITGAAAAGNTRLGPELAELNTLAEAHGSEAFLHALSRAVAFGRWRAADVRSILAARQRGNRTDRDHAVLAYGRDGRRRPRL